MPPNLHVLPLLINNLIKSLPQCFYLIANCNELRPHLTCVVFLIPQVTIKCLRCIEQCFLKHKTSTVCDKCSPGTAVSTGQLCSEIKSYSGVV